MVQTRIQQIQDGGRSPFLKPLSRHISVDQEICSWRWSRWNSHSGAGQWHTTQLSPAVVSHWFPQNL